MMSLKYFILLGFVVITNNLYSQVLASEKARRTMLYSNALNSLKNSVAKMRDSLSTKDDTDTFSRSNLVKLRQIEDTIYVMSDSYTSKLSIMPVACIDKYTLDYLNYIDLINYLYRAKSKDSISAIYDFIQEDLKIKKSVGWGINDTNIGLVKVKVRALDNRSGKELNGIKVFIKPVYTIAKRFIEEFNPTNNAVKDDVSPGRKLIYLEQQGKRAASREVTIGLNSKGYIYDFIL
jgi:hypothetical protein